MSFIRLGLWLLRRERASGEWRVLLLALIIGVGSVSTTGFLGDRLKRAMSEQGAGFLGADLLVTSPRPIDAWPDHALRTSSALEFASMVSRGDAFQLGPAEREVILDVGAALGIVGQLVLLMVAEAHTVALDAIAQIPVEARVDPLLVQFAVGPRLHEVLQLHLLELARAEDEVAGSNLVAK